MLRLLKYMIPVFLSLHLSVARYRDNDDQLPLSSLTDDVPRGEDVGKHHYLPEGNMAENEDSAETVNIDTRERSCIENSTIITCSGSKYTIVKCRESSLTSCHLSILKSGYKKCKTTAYTFFTKCGATYPTDCGCA
ncbi:hypothetical protein ACROYT_G036825 [Oculina patagonica]